MPHFPTVWPYFTALFVVQILFKTTVSATQDGSESGYGATSLVHSLTRAVFDTAMGWVRRSTRYGLFLAVPLTALLGAMALGAALMGHEKEGMTCLEAAFISGMTGWFLDLLASAIEDY
ncbi:hypothetical protein [Gluconobacter kondonii]|uniref:hypothetical protein n=1 Tax=Gluconobacter kondonii TaxID=941463 RepID=UPI001B8C2930|nr:hypothetical protein [Gluconobacter kondonii]MBS1058328.1 hypothetical protein [Gluconobacter kondonii]